MMQSLKEFLVEFDYIKNAISMPSQYHLENNIVYNITSYTSMFKRNNGCIYLNICPPHLSTITPYNSIIMSNNKIVFVSSNDEERIGFPYIKNDEEYFQLSTVRDLSNIPLEFFNECEKTYNIVCEKISKEHKL